MCWLSYHSSAGGLYKHRLCNSVLMFRFLWISIGPTNSALPVNTKEFSDDVRFRQKLLFHCCSLIMDFRCSCTCSRFSGSELCLLSIFTHSCVYLAFRYSLTKLHGMGVATSWWACTLFCDSLNKSLGWIILLMLRPVVWSFGCRLNSLGHVSQCGVLDNIYLYHLAIIWLVSPRILEFTEETLPKFTKIFILCAI